MRRRNVLDPRDVFVYGARPDGTPVIVQFAEGSPYTSITAMKRLAAKPLAGSTVEFLLIPRSMVRKDFQDRYEKNVTHAGIALFVVAELHGAGSRRGRGHP